MSGYPTHKSFDIKKFLMGGKYVEVSQIHKVLLFRICFTSKPSGDEETMLLVSILNSRVIQTSVGLSSL